VLLAFPLACAYPTETSGCVLLPPDEGVMTKGYSTNATDTAVQADIVAAGYGK
jgi:hypothetical protein